MTTHKRLVVQVRQDQWEWLQKKSAALQPVSNFVRSLLDKAIAEDEFRKPKTL